MSRFYYFHIESLNLTYPYYEDWFHEFPMELTDNQFERLCKALKGWIENEGFFQRGAWEDDGSLIRRDLPDIWEQYEEELAERAPVIWDKGVNQYLHSVDLFLPEEAYEEVFLQGDCEQLGE